MRGGVILLDKEKGRSSAWSSRLAGRKTGFRKAGHLGTLDPMATGLLVVMLGEATKFAVFAADLKKTYDATIKFGVTTDTGDMDGQVTGAAAVPGRLEEEIGRILPSFIGEIEQQVPAYSAHKYRGKAFYSYVREGKMPPPRRKTVLVESIQFSMESADTARLEIIAGKGTYIRSVAQELGERIGCGATLSALRRTRIGHFDVGDAKGGCVSTPDHDEQFAPWRILPAASLLQHMTAISVADKEIGDLKCGKRIRHAPSEELAPGAKFAVYEESGELCGVCELDADGMLRPVRMTGRA